MASATCPHCDKDIEICPHCGLSLLANNETAENAGLHIEEVPPPRVILPYPKRNLPVGVIGTVLGVFGLVGGMFMAVANFLSGLAVLLLSVLAIVGGSFLIIGTIVTACPLCGKPLRLPPNVQNTACPHCKTMCVRKGEYLEAIEL